MKRRITINDYIKAVKKADREIELSTFKKRLSFNKIHKSKKLYTRKIKHKRKEL